VNPVFWVFTIINSCFFCFFVFINFMDLWKRSSSRIEMFLYPFMCLFLAMFPRIYPNFRFVPLKPRMSNSFKSLEARKLCYQEKRERERERSKRLSPSEPQHRAARETSLFRTPRLCSPTVHLKLLFPHIWKHQGSWRMGCFAMLSHLSLTQPWLTFLPSCWKKCSQCCQNYNKFN
jgi:hypothetical protein